MRQYCASLLTLCPPDMTDMRELCAILSGNLSSSAEPCIDAKKNAYLFCEAGAG